MSDSLDKDTIKIVLFIAPRSWICPFNREWESLHQESQENSDGKWILCVSWVFFFQSVVMVTAGMGLMGSQNVSGQTHLKVTLHVFIFPLSILSLSSFSFQLGQRGREWKQRFEAMATRGGETKVRTDVLKDVCPDISVEQGDQEGESDFMSKSSHPSSYYSVQAESIS